MTVTPITILLLVLACFVGLCSIVGVTAIVLYKFARPEPIFRSYDETTQF